MSAKILFLRLTVPADLYKSAVLVEIHGVQVQVNAGLEEQENAPKTGKSQKHRQETPSKGVKTDKPRSTQSHVHDPGGHSLSHHLDAIGDGDEDDSEQFPTTVDLAKSFLYAEPKEEKAELQAAIVQSQSLDQSQVSNEDGEEISDLGVGNTFSLPSFLADFLKGVGDRIQLKVKDVELDLNLKVDSPSEGSTSSDASDRSEIVVIRVSVKEIVSDGVASSAVSTTPTDDQRDSESGLHEFRQFSLSSIEAIVISEASLFASLARSAAPSSPEITHASITRSTGNKPATSPSSTSTPETRLSSRFGDTNAAAVIPPNIQADIKSNSERFADGEDGNQTHEGLETMYPAAVERDRYQENMLSDSFFSSGEDSPAEEEKAKLSDSILDSPLFSDVKNHGQTPQHSQWPHEIAALRSLSVAESPPAKMDTFHSSSSSPVGASESDQGFASEGNSHLSHDLRISGRPKDFGPQTESKVFDSSVRTTGPDRYSNYPPEDLTQSKIFSHEEAESMYMSAISHASLPKKSDSLSVPANWGCSNSDDRLEGKTFAASRRAVLSRGGSTSPARQPPIQDIGVQLGSYDADMYGERSTDPEPRATTRNSNKFSRLAPNLQDEILSSKLKGHHNTSTLESDTFSTFKSSLTMVKRFLFVDAIVVELPQGESKPTTVSAEHQNQRSGANSQKIPGDFGEESSFDTMKTSGTVFEAGKIHSSSRPAEEQSYGQTTSIDIGNIEILADMGLTKMTVLLIEQLNALRQPRPENPHDVVLQPHLEERSQLRLKINSASWKFLDLVKGIPITGIQPENPKLGSSAFSEGCEILLRADVKAFNAVRSKAGSFSISKLSVGKFSFGYVSEDILSFDSGLKMRESTRDILASSDNDMLLSITNSNSTLKIDFDTIPLHIALDLRRLEETFSWLGGLSTMLGLGSSMVSTVTIKDLNSGPGSSSKNIRGVHFETPDIRKPSRSRSIAPQNKVTARIGGLVFDLQGSQSSLRLESTAMKIVSRTEGLGLQIDRLKLSGPYLQEANSEPSIVAMLLNCRVEYLSTPKEVDLARLLALLSPSKDKYERDDDILLDTLLRQRRQGGIVRATVENLESSLSHLDDLQCFPALAEDLRKLSTVTKYLPEDDRPGILTLGLIRNLRLDVTVNEGFGAVNLASRTVEVAHVTFPSLVALGITTLHLHRNHQEELIGEALPTEINDESRLPMFMARFVGNEMEPTAKMKLHNVRMEYHVSPVMAMLGIKDATTSEAIVADMVSSVATLTGQQPTEARPPRLSNQTSASSDTSTGAKALRFDIALRDSIIGLNPRNSPAKGLVVLTDTHFLGIRPREEEANATLDIRKASVMVIDDSKNVVRAETAIKRKSFDDQCSQIEALSNIGYVSVSLISAAKATLQIVRIDDYPGKAVDLEIRDDLFILESCADSTQTLQTIMNGLKPPMPPSTELKYRTEVVPVEDMLASFSGDAFATRCGSDEGENELALGLDDGDMVEDEVPQNLEFVSSFYNPDPDATYEGIADSMLEEDLESLAAPSVVREIGDKNLLESFQEQAQIAPGNTPLSFQDDHFGASPTVGGTAHRWNTKQNTYGLSNDFKLRSSPLRVRVRDVHIIWNLFDGYDWQRTRDAISQAVENVQNKATERLSRKDKRKSLDLEEEEESVIGDFLFNSIYIGIPAHRDPRELARQVNRNLDDLASETESYATSSSSGSPSRQGHMQRSRSRKLRLRRSKYHKMSFELKGISADVVTFPPGSGETESSIDIRVQDLEIFDHVPTSTWKKFATYMHDAGERESGTSMIHLEMLNVKPVPNLAASEIILKVSV